MAQSESKNDYRSERKQRIAHQAKKGKAKKIDSTQVISVIITVICIVALLAGIAGGLYVYGVPQKIMPAVSVDGRTYSVAEYSYYYTTVYQTYANQSYSYYENYGFSIGFDYKKDAAAQTTTDDDGNEITYDEFFKQQVMQTLESYNYYLDKAKAEGLTLSDENKQSIEDNIADLASYASQYGYSTGRYISVLYGKGLNEKKLRSLMEEQFIVAQYVEKIENDASAAITTEDIEAEYEKDPSAYQQVDVRLFGFEIPTDEETTVESEETTEATGEETTVEETTVEETTVEETAAADTETTVEGEETTVAEETTTEKAEPTAQELLAQEMLDRITDENSFIELAKEYCAEEDAETFEDESATRLTGLKKSTVSSNIDADLAEWLFSTDRQVGDKTMVTTDEYVYVLYMTATPYRNETPLVTARHILVSYDTVKSELEANAADTETDTETETETDLTDAETTQAQDTAAFKPAVADVLANATKAEVGELTDVVMAAAPAGAEDETAADDETAAEDEATVLTAAATANGNDLTASDGTQLTNNYSYSNEVLVETYNRALDILKEYNEGEKTEDAFAALAEKYSEDTASTSAGDNGVEGGLYEDIEKGAMVAEFENWVYDESRQPGDVGIVLTTYGAHVMYFVEKADEAAYIATIRSTLASAKVTAAEDEVKAATDGTAKLSVFGSFAQKQAAKLVTKLYSSSSEE